jgi:hypothetical protein
LESSFRTPTVGATNAHDESKTFRDYVVFLLLNVIPKQFEFNVGTSVGYMIPASSGDTELCRRFAYSIDGNVRISYPIGQLGIYANMGVSYLWTKKISTNNSIRLGWRI